MILSLVGQKGGAGKTTVALCVASELVSRGKRVLLVDADPQGTARTWGAVASEAGVPAPTVVALGADLWKPHQLPALAPTFDAVVVDAPPRHAEVMRAALMVADVALLPCGPSANDVWALAESVEHVRSAQKVRPGLRAAVVLTRLVSGTVLGAGAREALSGSGLPVLKSTLGFRVAYQEAPAAGLGAAQYEPRSEAAAEVRALTDEVLELAGAHTKKRRK